MGNGEQSGFYFCFCQAAEQKSFKSFVVLDVGEDRLNIRASLSSVIYPFFTLQQFEALDLKRFNSWLTSNILLPCFIVPPFKGHPVQLIAWYLAYRCSKPFSVVLRGYLFSSFLAHSAIEAILFFIVIQVLVQQILFFFVLCRSNCI